MFPAQDFGILQEQGSSHPGKKEKLFRKKLLDTFS